jgi:hypothetical protein
MKPMLRYEWIENHMRSDRLLARGGVDILDRDFVDSYIEATQARHQDTNWGASKCPQLGRDLAEMVKMGVLRRSRVGLSGGAWMSGFPKWVWCYRLTFP